MVSIHTTIKHGTDLTAQEKLVLLKERAHALAQVPEQTETVRGHLEITEFCLSVETYAFESSSIREVCSLKGLTLLPSTPPFVLGITNVRGRILSVIDIALLFGLSPQEVNTFSKAIIIKAEELEVGILTTTVLGVRRLPLSVLLPPLSALTTARSRYVKGVTSAGLILLDAQKLLAGTRLGNHE